MLRSGGEQEADAENPDPRVPPLATVAPTAARVLERATLVGATAGLLIGLLAPSPAGAVAGGRPADPEAYRWVVPLLRTSHEKPLDAFSCTGYAVAGDWVLTAAHCVEEAGRVYAPHEIDVGVGSARLSTITRRVPVAQVVVYPRYRPWKVFPRQFLTRGRDVALLRTAEPLGVPVAVLGSRRDSPDVRGAAYPGFFAGWGMTPGGPRASDDLLVGRASVIPRTRCRSFIRRQGGFPGTGPGTRPVRGSLLAPWGTICAGLPNAGEAAPCPGDSGGPLAVGPPGRPRILGVLNSFVGLAEARCVTNRTARWSDTVAYAQWIQRVIRGQDPGVGYPETELFLASDRGRFISLYLKWSQADGAGHRVRVTFVGRRRGSARPRQGLRARFVARTHHRVRRRGGSISIRLPDVYRNGNYQVTVKIKDLTSGLTTRDGPELLQVRGRGGGPVAG